MWLSAERPQQRERAQRDASVHISAQTSVESVVHEVIPQARDVVYPWSTYARTRDKQRVHSAAEVSTCVPLLYTSKTVRLDPSVYFCQRCDINWNYKLARTPGVQTRLGPPRAFFTKTLCGHPSFRAFCALLAAQEPKSQSPTLQGFGFAPPPHRKRFPGNEKCRRVGESAAVGTRKC